MFSINEKDKYDLSNKFILNATDSKPEELEDILTKIKRCKFYGDIKWPVNIDKDSNKKLMDEIKEQLKVNNNEFTRFPNDFTHAYFSRHVYEFLGLEKDCEVKKFNDETWKVHEIFKSPK
jgi:hypothetical protein